jgi:hypothetical protein
MIWAECSKTVPNTAARGRSRVEMHRDGRRRAEAGLPADMQGKSLRTRFNLRCKISKIGSIHVSSYSTSKDANHQGQNSTSSISREKRFDSAVRIAPANSHALTPDEHASCAKAATSTSHGAVMRCVGCNQYQALMSSIAEFLHTQVRCHDRVLSYMFASCEDVPRAREVKSCS